MLDYKNIIIKRYALKMSGAEIAKEISASKSGVNDFLKAFKECENGFPSRLTEKKWNKILDEMIEGFELHCTKDEWEFEQDLNARNEKFAKVNKALKLFSKHFHDLWW